MKIIQRLKCIITKSHDWKFSCNVYGDQIMTTGGMRSVWKCSKCGAYQLRPKLYRGEIKQYNENINK